MGIKTSKKVVIGGRIKIRKKNIWSIITKARLWVRHIFDLSS